MQFAQDKFVKWSLRIILKSILYIMNTNPFSDPDPASLPTSPDQENKYQAYSRK